MLDLLMANVDVFAWGYNAFAKAQEEVRMHLVTHSPCQRCSPATTSGNSCFATPLGCGLSAAPEWPECLCHSPAACLGSGNSR